MRGRPVVLVPLLLLSGCAGFPDGAYYPGALDQRTTPVAESLYLAARAAGDDPHRYSFALIRTRDVSALSSDDAVFYFSEGLVRQPRPHVDALVAHEVAHEVLGHAGQRRALSVGLKAGFTVLGVVVPGLGFADFLVNPLVVRAFTRDQEIAADLKAVEILRTMGYERPRETLAAALQAAATINGPRHGGLLAAEPPLEDRLNALGPLEPLPDVARAADGR